jgi:rfaE bifunctional protein nucleotidyltransferase chain/domain
MEVLKLSNTDKKISRNNKNIKYEKHEPVNYKDVICEKPWGYEFLAYESNKIGMWFLNIKQGHMTSVHTHFNKDTIMIVIQGCVRLELSDGEVRVANQGDSVYIPKYKFHSMGSFSPNSLILEIEIFDRGVSFSDKNDLLRINDVYKRNNNFYNTSINRTSKDDRYFYFETGFLNPFFKVSDKPLRGATYNIILDGMCFSNGKCIGEGSFIDDIEDNDHNAEFLCVFTEPDRKVIYTIEQLNCVVKNVENIVLTSGCFDIIHRGHIHTLKAARNMGDILMVCLSSDEQIRKLKGELRPVNKYEDRIDMIKNIECVDYVILYNEENDEETLGSIMKIVNPDVWVKGADYTYKEIRQKHPYLKNIRLVETIKGVSTTSIIDRIKK